MAPDPQNPFDDDFNVVGGEIFASFSPWASWLGDGNPFAPTAIPSLSTEAGGTAALGDPSAFVPVTSGGITINLIYDAAALAAPASFRAGIQQAVAILAAAISDKITVNIKIDYSGTGGGASAGPDHGIFQSYFSIRADLVNNASAGDPTFNALTAGSSIQGQSSVAVWNAQLKLWGLMAANDTTTDDGAANFATDINPNLLVGVALHELTHAMGRIPYGTPNSPSPDIFDLFRFTSAGTRLFQGGSTAPAAYFSLDGGNTKVADYGRTSDPSDFLNSGVQGPNDPFNEFYTGSTSQQLTAVDLKQLDALGFHTMGAANVGSVSINDVAITEGNSGTHLATFTVTRTGGAAAFAVNFATSDGTATAADNDYVTNAGTLNFATGVNTQTVSVFIVGDTKFESDESFFVNLSGATNGASISGNLGIGTIINDDPVPAPSVAINDVTVTEGNNGTKVATFTVTHSGGPAAFAVNFATSDGSATIADHDYVAGSGTLNFATGVDTQTISVTINGDTKIESNETFSVTLSGATNGAIISDGHGIGTIANDDAIFAPDTFQFAAFAPQAGGWSSQHEYPRELADVNGDGMADIVGFAFGGVNVSLATGDGHFAPMTGELGTFGVGAGGWSSQDLYPRLLGDVDGDGKADIVAFGAGGVSVSLATGSGHFASPTNETGTFGFSAGGWTSENEYPRELADVNGDGMADIVGFAFGGVNVSLATGNGHFAPMTSELGTFGAGAGGWSSQDLYPRLLGDVNGDGMADIVAFGAGGVSVALATGNGHFASPTNETGSFGFSAGGWTSENEYPRLLADVNGDGMADIVGFGAGGVSVSLATGNGHFAAAGDDIGAFGANAGGWASQDLYPRALGDVNGDGTADIIGFGPTGVHEALSHAFHLI
jgi:hypothetical protein